MLKGRKGFQRSESLKATRLGQWSVWIPPCALPIAETKELPGSLALTLPGNKARPSCSSDLRVHSPRSAPPTPPAAHPSTTV